MQEEKNIKYDWETIEQLEYRQNIEKLCNRVSLALSKMPQVLSNLCYEKILDDLRVEYNLLILMLTDKKVPILYNESHKLLLDGLKYYVRAFKLLVSNTKGIDLNVPKLKVSNEKTALINKSSKFILAGNAYMTIVTTKNLEMYEIMAREYMEQYEIMARKYMEQKARQG